MSYKQLIEGQRYQIQAYLSQHLSYREIGRRLNVSHSCSGQLNPDTQLSRFSASAGGIPSLC
ncbi:helix-turn-helix domain-containing protein [Aeromonas salmonicida subsp. pectinolytica]